ncbi:hypothetical protein ABZU76_22155 [Amycolatopsis sp. NPDC005232]|uniref:hypothetical protein n=1 Tax=Amycolatopsis sp. NPDC005232 TaxID=3157027 RepID=UPI0033BB6EEF
MSKVVWLAGLALVLAACSSPAPSSPHVASLGTPSVTASSSAPASTDADGGRPRHRVDESPEDSQRLIEPWRTCMKDHDADVDQQPHSIAGAEQWSKDHQAAGDACRSKLPLLPWGEDPANPAYKDNLHRWVECMTSQGMHVAEDPDDDESPWHYTSNNQPPNSDKIEQGCEVQVMGPSDK